MTKPDPSKTHIQHAWKHSAPLMACKIDPTGRFVFAASEDQSIQRWDLNAADGKSTALAGHESWPWALACSPDGATLYSGGFDGRLIWHPVAAEKPTPLRTVEAHHGWIRAVAPSPDGTRVATAGNDKVIRVWSATDGSLIQEMSGHEKPVYSLAYHANGYDFVSGDLKGEVRHWEAPTGKLIRKLDAGKLYEYNGGQQVDYGGVRGLDFSPDGQWLVAAGLIEASNPLGAVSNPAFVLFKWDDGKETSLQRLKEDTKGVAWGVRFHPEGFYVSVLGGTGGGHLAFFRPGETNQFAVFNLTNTGRGLDLHPDGLRIATGHHDGHVRICSMTEKPKT